MLLVIPKNSENFQERVNGIRAYIYKTPKSFLTFLGLEIIFERD